MTAFGFVNTGRRGVKVPSVPVEPGRTDEDSRPSVAIRAALVRREHALTADLAYAVLLVAAFAILALTLRGLEKL